jgi:hypothetical protein
MHLDNSELRHRPMPSMYKIAAVFRQQSEGDGKGPKGPQHANAFGDGARQFYKTTNSAEALQVKITCTARQHSPYRGFTSMLPNGDLFLLLSQSLPRRARSQALLRVYDTPDGPDRPSRFFRPPNRHEVAKLPNEPNPISGHSCRNSVRRDPLLASKNTKLRNEPSPISGHSGDAVHAQRPQT